MDHLAAALKFNPNQPRDPGGEDGGQWTSGLKVGGRVEVTDGADATTGKPVSGTAKGPIVRLSDTQVMINAGSKKKPRWVVASRGNAKPVERAKPQASVGPGRRGFWERLSAKEQAAVDAYKGHGYKKINGQLRAGKPGGETVRLLDSAITKGSLGSGAKLYRSFHISNLPKPGDVVTDSGFASTSTRREVAERFTKIGNGKRALVRITAPAGTPAAFLPGQNEDEVLLGRNSNFVVKAVKNEHGVLVIDVEVISHEPGH